MSELSFKIGAFNAETRAVPVTFTSGEIVHKRDVNAVLKADGSYDKAATKARVEEVAMGVAHKIAAGVITKPEPETAEVATASE
ncbi:hypothetical protein [Novosphingobium sp. PY1]|uniref:hypothetical protein n=1 Tax=Novosphingobium sp. PY1 TaxID=1882221 RepID=UPI001A8D802D|nr:hypothetical protein [Novosphingobium sp. PY1]GFM28145.1 uncharacterized protein PY1_contig-04-193 [Novosphingobium sp. PY1]